MPQMFRCRECGSDDFRLMLQPDFAGKVEIYENEHLEVMVRVNDKEFVADLMFMNQFAVCKACDAIRCWEYYFPSQLDEAAEASG